ncbi:MAG: DUF748 domain-containing protein [Chitinophagales bacterium]
METTPRNLRRISQLTVVLLPVVAALDSLLPFLLKKLVNRFLSKNDKISGEVGSIHFSFLKRLLIIKQAAVWETAADDKFVAISFQQASIRFNWKEIRKGNLEIDLNLESPSIFFRKMNNVTSEIRTLLLQPVPVYFNLKTLRVHNGSFTYADLRKEPRIEINTVGVSIAAQNITNMMRPEALPGSIEVAGRILGGEYAAHANLNLSLAAPRYDVTLRVKDIEIPRTNRVLLHYAHLVFHQGKLDLFAEAAGRGRNVTGYIKPFLKQPEFDRVPGIPGKPNAFWYVLIRLFTMLLKNEYGAIATKIPFEGTWPKPHFDLGEAAAHSLVNSFVQAIPPKIENNINIHSVRERG